VQLRAENAMLRSQLSAAGGSWKRWLLAHGDGGAAPLWILLNGLVAMVMVLLPYKLLIAFTMTVMAPSTFLCLAAFIALRLQEPELVRDFRVPGGIGALTCMSLLPAGVTVAQVCGPTTTSRDL
jgi:hypothetical protein